MKSLTDEEVLARSNGIRWSAFEYSTSGELHCYAIVVLNETDKPYEHVEHFILDKSVDVKSWVESILDHFNESLRENENPRRFVRFLDLGPSNAHAFIRMATSTEEGEKFKCSKCGLQVVGYPSLGQRLSPYRFTLPREKKKYLKMINGCKS